MRRLILTIAAATAVAASAAATAELAYAQDGRRFERNSEGRWRDRGPPRPDRPGGERRVYPAYPVEPEFRAPRALRPGGYLPPQLQGPPVMDYDRYRLRPPPHGYRWVRAGDSLLLVDRNGQIFDVIR